MKEFTLEIFANLPWNEQASINVNKGEVYSFEVLAKQKWKDKWIWTDANGFWNPLLVFTGKRVKGALCFKLCGNINKKDSAYFPIGLKLQDFLIEETGHLYLFANDSKQLKYYDNNSGSIKVVVTRTQ